MAYCLCMIGLLKMKMITINFDLVKNSQLKVPTSNIFSSAHKFFAWFS